MDALAHPAASEALERVYQRCREPLLRKARNWFPGLRGHEADLYQSAWESVLRNLDGIDSVEAYLETAVYTEGLFELRKRRRRQASSLDKHGAVPGDRTAPLPEEEVEVRADAGLLAEVLERLTPLQKKVVALRWAWGLSRQEAASRLAVSERVVKRELEAASGVIADSIELLDSGRWCETKKSLVLAYSFDLLSERRAAKAKRHLEVCPGCREAVRVARDRAADVAALVPLPLLLGKPPTDGVFENAVEVTETLRATLSEFAASVKQHAFALISRTPAAEAATQTATAGGLRGSGGIAAAVTACVLAGSGATYCAVEGLPLPVREPVRADAPDKAEHQRATTTPEPVPVAVQPPPATSGPPDSSDQRAKTEDSTTHPSPPVDSADQIPASPAPVGSQEVGSTPQANAPRAPAPAPTSGGGEFTP
jgi:RNA polymerase sigma factor (sigma-70 family)